MTRAFELFTGLGSRLPMGPVVAVSARYRKASADEGIRVVREYAGMALIADLCPLPGDSHEGPVRTV